ncbi:MAG: sodium:proton antiporter [Phycisphaerales bacterium]|nr:sodium:proton antiporter [Phycisphaerales bacterium]
MAKPEHQHDSQGHPLGTEGPKRTLTLGICIALLLAMAAALALSLGGDHGAHDEAHAGAHAPSWWGLGTIPFVALLGAIAVLPLISRVAHWWHSNLSRLLVSVLAAGGTLLYVWAAIGWHDVGITLQHAVLDEYVPFIILLFTLYVISGGIHLGGDLPARPITNTAILAVGAGIASFIGTTGASMLLIRPLLKTNQARQHKVHTVVMFIFLVSNIGGALLPIGDPPLFLGYLAGVPFFWTFSLWGPWLLVSLILLVVYYFWDSMLYRREAPVVKSFDLADVEPLRLDGWWNLIWLGGIVCCVAFIQPGKPVPFTDWIAFDFLRELCMLALVVIALLSTPGSIRKANRFDYHAIIEVAVIFIGIFIAMQVPLTVLKAEGSAISAQLTESWMYFWITGGLSSVLDNAPTYLVFFELAQSAPPGETVVELQGDAGVIDADLLRAISLGAVFLGAMTYIGNGPNFMVKAIAEQDGVKMPSFFGYVVRYALPVLVPVFAIVAFFML